MKTIFWETITCERGGALRHFSLNDFDILMSPVLEDQRPRVHVPNFGGVSGSEDRGGGDNSIQFINFGRVGDKSFKEWQQKIGGWKGG